MVERNREPRNLASYRTKTLTSIPKDTSGIPNNIQRKRNSRSKYKLNDLGYGVKCWYVSNCQIHQISIERAPTLSIDKPLSAHTMGQPWGCLGHTSAHTLGIEVHLSGHSWPAMGIRCHPHWASMGTRWQTHWASMGTCRDIHA